ncbi:cytochrome P450 mono-oxygenase [Artemisia annua]|uniref:Cytochrome P450 mono-oxygenase n=1 Tax=Artemisia annua TaxID=35608 RepID=A0A2U1MDS7_ARTAN|nr:cytochrome P450 mono-oxygenase [Artemisia annua]
MDSLLQFLLASLPILYLLYQLIPKIIKNKSKSNVHGQFRSPPGPHGMPFIGNLHQIDKSNFHISLWSLSKSYGPVVSLNLGFIPAIVISSASVAKEILKTQDLTFCSRPSFHGLQRSLPILYLLYLIPKIIKNKSKSNVHGQFRSPPGPHGMPFIGNLHQIDKSNFHISLWSLSKSYGPVVSLNLGFIPAIVVSSASVAKEILKTQDLTFCSRPSFHGLQRSSRFIREDEVSLAMEKIHGLALSSKHVNLSEIAHIVMSNMVTRIGFGKRYEDGYESKEILRLLHELQATLTNYFISDLWPDFPLVGLIDRLLGKFYRLEKCLQGLDSFYQNLIDEHLDTEYSKPNEEHEDLIDILLQLRNGQLSDSFELTNDHMKAMLTDILVAGTDNSAATLVWAMTTLVKYPKAMKKAQEEVRKMVQNKDKVDEDDLPKLTYLKAVVKEVMRLYPAAPLLIPRVTMKDAILLDYKIKQNTLVYVNAMAIGRDPESWENPEEFSPERFLGSDIGFKGSDFELIPFGAGRRICPGISMGVNSVELFLANLIYSFDWGLPDGTKIEDIDSGVLPGLTMTNKKDLCLLAHFNSNSPN